VYGIEWPYINKHCLLIYSHFYRTYSNEHYKLILVRGRSISWTPFPSWINVVHKCCHICICVVINVGLNLKIHFFSWDMRMLLSMTVHNSKLNRIQVQWQQHTLDDDVVCGVGWWKPDKSYTIIILSIYLFLYVRHAIPCVWHMSVEINEADMRTFSRACKRIQPGSFECRFHNKIDCAVVFIHFSNAKRYKRISIVMYASDLQKSEVWFTEKWRLIYRNISLVHA